MNSAAAQCTGVSRRSFLTQASALAAFGLSFWTGGCEGCLQQIKNRPTRRNIANLAANDPIVTTYKNAVAAMKALPSSNPISWVAQANIHFNKCPHGCWFFLPWHRAYLLYFERICRKVTGDATFALPYWNWTTSASIPSPFWGGASNPLYDSTRMVGPSDQADPSWVGASVIQNILSTPSFTLFASDKPPGGLPTHTGSGYGELEATPHNNIHGWIGGDMGAFHSPLDPIFWMHHNMLDCLWVDWNINLNNANTNDTSWTNYNLTDFVDENGSPVSVPVIDTVLYPILLYQFEPCAPAETNKGALTGSQLQKFLREGAPSALTFGPPHAASGPVVAEGNKPVKVSIPMDAPTLQNVLGSDAHNRLVLTLDGVDLPASAEVFVRVFLDKSDASAETSIDDPHYAGSFGVFSDPQAMAGMAGDHLPKFLVDLTSTLQKLNRAGGVPTDRVDLALIAVPYNHRRSPEQHEQVIKIQSVVLGSARF
jgi:tyrosinase